MEKTKPGKAHENGDVESCHRHFKEAVDQALMLRGSRDFASREEYAAFLRELLEQKNAGRRKRLDGRTAGCLQPLPPRRLESCKRLRVRVGRGQSDSREAERLLGGQPVDRRAGGGAGLRRAPGSLVRPEARSSGCRGCVVANKHRINYRHVIDWLVRKPGAFENYRYREDLFPTSRFRMAYDSLARTMHASWRPPRVPGRFWSWRLGRASQRSMTRCDVLLEQRARP